jgi:hypothetical protein
VQLNKHTTPTPWEFAGDTRLTECPQDRCDGIPFSEYHCHLQLRSHKSCAFMDFGQLRVRRLAAVSLFPWFPSRPFSLHYFRPGTLQIVTVSPVAITAVSPRNLPRVFVPIIPGRPPTLVLKLNSRYRWSFCVTPFSMADPIAVLAAYPLRWTSPT